MSICFCSNSVEMKYICSLKPSTRAFAQKKVRGAKRNLFFFTEIPEYF
jgi:hypothetical protein